MTAIPPSQTSFDRRQIAPLGVGIVAVYISAEHQATLVGLADVEVSSAKVMTWSISGFTPSETNACITWLSIGKRKPAIRG